MPLRGPFSARACRVAKPFFPVTVTAADLPASRLQNRGWRGGDATERRRRFHASEAASEITGAAAVGDALRFRRGADPQPRRGREDAIHPGRSLHGDRRPPRGHAGLLRRRPTRIPALRYRRAGRGVIPDGEHRHGGWRAPDPRPHRGGALQRRHPGRPPPRGPRPAHSGDRARRDATCAPPPFRSRHRPRSPRSFGAAARLGPGRCCGSSFEATDRFATRSAAHSAEVRTSLGARRWFRKSRDSMTTVAITFAPMMAPAVIVCRSQEPMTATKAKAATSKHKKSMSAPKSTCRSRSARAKSPAAAHPKRTNRAQCTTVYAPTRPGVMTSAPASRRPWKTAAPRRAGVRKGAPDARSTTRNQTATAAAPAMPTRTPSKRIGCRPMLHSPLVVPCPPRRAVSRSKPGRMALKKAFWTSFTITWTVLTFGFSRGPEMLARVATSSWGRFSRTRLITPTTFSYIRWAKLLCLSFAGS